jgi:hypothetical protein
VLGRRLRPFKRDSADEAVKQAGARGKIQVQRWECLRPPDGNEPVTLMNYFAAQVAMKDWSINLLGMAKGFHHADLARIRRGSTRSAGGRDCRR